MQAACQPGDIFQEAEASLSEGEADPGEPVIGDRDEEGPGHQLQPTLAYLATPVLLAEECTRPVVGLSGQAAQEPWSVQCPNGGHAGVLVGLHDFHGPQVEKTTH